MRVLAMVLLGPGSPESFPSGAFIEPAQQTMFPFQILLWALPPVVEGKLWQQVPRWPRGPAGEVPFVGPATASQRSRREDVKKNFTALLVEAG